MAGIIENAQRGAGLASAGDYVRSQVGLDPASQQAQMSNQVNQATQALMQDATPQGLAEMGMNPQAIQMAMQNINARSTAALDQRQAQSGAITIPEYGAGLAQGF